MLQIRGLGKAFSGEWLFRSVDFHIVERDRIGLVGDNGTGKPTLLKMLPGLLVPDEGEINGPKDLTYGYVPQDGLFARGRTIFQEALAAFQELQGLERECRRLEHSLAHSQPGDPEYQRMSERYARASQEFRIKGGYRMEAQAGAVLHGPGFEQKDWRRPCDEFSGRWQMCLALARLLLQQPHLLLLDEPTNHLDLEARNWLEEYLSGYPHALVLVSHDRFFHDALVGRIMEIRRRAVHFYTGNYSDFLKQRKEWIAQQVAAYEAQQRRIARIRAFAEKFRYKASRAAQVQSRLKGLERLEPIELPPDAKSIRFRFPEGPRTRAVVLELVGVTAGYGGEPVFRDLDLLLSREDRIALVGPNGAGKSTLMRILAGRLPLMEGERRVGYNVVVGFFSQDQDDMLISERTVWDEVCSVAPDYIVPDLRTLSGCFLFSGDEVEKRISVLSGGERSRLVLRKLLLLPANCLLLDEPTNHLDIRSKDILMDSLREYGGTLVFGSHDGYFLEGLATKVVEVGSGTATVYLGTYEDYLAKKRPNRNESLRQRSSSRRLMAGARVRRASAQGKRSTLTRYGNSPERSRSWNRPSGHTRRVSQSFPACFRLRSCTAITPCSRRRWPSMNVFSGSWNGTWPNENGCRVSWPRCGPEGMAAADGPAAAAGSEALPGSLRECGTWPRIWAWSSARRGDQPIGTDHSRRCAGGRASRVRLQLWLEPHAC